MEEEAGGEPKANGDDIGYMPMTSPGQWYLVPYNLNLTILAVDGSIDVTNPLRVASQRLSVVVKPRVPHLLTSPQVWINKAQKGPYRVSVHSKTITN